MITIYLRFVEQVRSIIRRSWKKQTGFYGHKPFYRSETEAVIFKAKYT